MSAPGGQDVRQGRRQCNRIMPWSTVLDRDGGEHEPRTQRFCRTIDRFGVTNRLTVGKNYIGAQAG